MVKIYDIVNGIPPTRKAVSWRAMKEQCTRELKNTFIVPYERNVHFLGVPNWFSNWRTNKNDVRRAVTITESPCTGWVVLERVKLLSNMPIHAEIPDFPDYLLTQRKRPGYQRIDRDTNLPIREQDPV